MRMEESGLTTLHVTLQDFSPTAAEFTQQMTDKHLKRDSQLV